MVGADSGQSRRRNDGIRADGPTTAENRGRLESKNGQREEAERRKKRKKGAGAGAFCRRRRDWAGAESAVHHRHPAHSTFLSLPYTYMERQIDTL